VKNKNNKIIIFMAIITTLIFYLNLDIIPTGNLLAKSYIPRFFEKFFRSLHGFSILSLPVFIGIYMIYKKWYFKSAKNVPVLIISIFISIMNVVGYSFQKYKSFKGIFDDLFQMFKASIFIIGYVFIIYILLKKLFEFFENNSYKNIKFKRFNKAYDFVFVKHPFIMPLLIMLACWIPYIIFYFPGCSTGTDTRNQIYMYYGIDSFLTNSVIPLKQGVYLNNLHPLLHSLFTGFCLDIGFSLFHSYTIGFFIYTFVQVSIMLLILSYTIVWMKKQNIPNWIRVVSLILYCFLSFYPYFAITHGKDTMFSLLMILLVMKVYELVQDNKIISNKKYFFSLMGIIFGILFFRNDGLYRIIFTFFFIIIFNKKIIKKLLLLLMVPITTYLIYLHILLPIFSIPSGNVREMLSVPFQQTARTVYMNGYNAYKKDDKEVIKKIIDYDNLKKLYKPNISDPVKNTYNLYASKEDLNKYYKVWFKYLFKYPKDYVESFINNTYGYFYIDLVYERGFGYTSLLQLDDGIFNIKYIGKFKLFRDGLNIMNRTFKRVPILYLLYSTGFYDVFIIIITGYLLYKKLYKYILILVPLYSVILINLLSPVNGHFRYTLPIIFSFPILLCIITNISKKESKD